MKNSQQNYNNIANSSFFPVTKDYWRQFPRSKKLYKWQHHLLSLKFLHFVDCSIWNSFELFRFFFADIFHSISIYSTCVCLSADIYTFRTDEKLMHIQRWLSLQRNKFDKVISITVQSEKKKRKIFLIKFYLIFVEFLIIAIFFCTRHSIIDWWQLRMCLGVEDDDCFCFRLHSDKRLKCENTQGTSALESFIAAWIR